MRKTTLCMKEKGTGRDLGVEFSIYPGEQYLIPAVDDLVSISAEHIGIVKKRVYAYDVDTDLAIIMIFCGQECADATRPGRNRRSLRRSTSPSRWMTSISAQTKSVRQALVQPVVYLKDGERRIGEMKWGFQFPKKLVFNARSDNLTTSDFWNARIGNRCIVPASSMLEWKKTTGKEPRLEVPTVSQRTSRIRHGGLMVTPEESEDGQMGRHVCDHHSDPNTR